MQLTIFSKKLLLLTVLLSSQNIAALEITNNVKYNSSYLSYSDPTQNNTSSTTYTALNYRLNLSEKFKNVKLESHYQLSSVYNNNGISYTNPDQYRLFDLSSSISDSNKQITSHRFDRLFITYDTTNTSTKFGRQAITWGNGLVYNVMDIFNPFSPSSIDKEYKAGDDMLYIQHLDNTGNDWQFIYLPRRDSHSDINETESSLAAKYHLLLLESDLDILFAYHYDSHILGAGFSHPIGESLWRLDITVTETADNKKTTSLVSNIDYSWTAFNKNFYGFIEFYHNGFGNTDSITPTNYNLNDRISRGEIFTYYKNYFSTGVRIELHPLLTLSPTLIHEPDNKTSSIVINLSYDWTQHLSFKSNLLYNKNNNKPTNNSIDFLLSYYF